MYQYSAERQQDFMTLVICDHQSRAIEKFKEEVQARTGRTHFKRNPGTRIVFNKPNKGRGAGKAHSHDIKSLWQGVLPYGVIHRNQASRRPMSFSQPKLVEPGRGLEEAPTISAWSLVMCMYVCFRFSFQA